MRRQSGLEVTVPSGNDVTVSPEKTSVETNTTDNSLDSAETDTSVSKSMNADTPDTEMRDPDMTDTADVDTLDTDTADVDTLDTDTPDNELLDTDASSESPPIGYVVLGDVVDSRSIEDRAAFRETFATARRAVVTTLGGTLSVGPTVLKGIDEIGLVLSSIDRLYDLVITLADALHPHQIRLAVARGPVDTTVTDSVARMDGEAFHRATDLLESIDTDGLLFGLDADRSPLDTAVTDEINLLVDRRASWTDRQREIVAAYERTGVQHEVASELGISQQAVSDVLRSADWPLVETIEGRLRETLATYDGGDR